MNLRLGGFDGNISSETAVIDFTISAVNDFPVIISEPNLSAQENNAYSYPVEATDEEDDILGFRLITNPEGMNIDVDTGQITWLPNHDQAGEHQVEVEVTDGPSIDTQTLIIIVANSNRVPSITSTPSTIAFENYLYHYDVIAIDADGNSLSYFLSVAPAEMSIDSVTGLITWSPVYSHIGTHTVVVTVQDGIGGEVSQQYDLTVTPRPNTAPSVSSSPILSVMQSDTYQYQIIAIDAENDPISFELTTAPTGMLIDVTRLIYWEPSVSAVGNHAVAITLSDDRGASYIHSYELSVITGVSTDLRRIPLPAQIQIQTQTQTPIRIPTLAPKQIR